MAVSKNEKIKPLVILRKNVGLSRNKAAVMLDIGLTTLTRYENGDNDVPFGVGEKMAVLYKVPFEDVRFAIRDTKELNGMYTQRKGAKKDVAMFAGYPERTE